MTPPEPSGDSRAPQDLFREVQLGDALGDDRHLLDNLIRIDETIRGDSPKAEHWLVNLLCMAKAFLPAACRTTVKAFQVVAAGVLRFTDHETRKIAAEAAAYETRKLADANAHKTTVVADAQVRRMDAESLVLLSQGTAIAEEEGARTRRKDELLRAMDAKGIKRISEHDDQSDILRTLFTKDPGPKMLDGPDPEKPLK